MLVYTLVTLGPSDFMDVSVFDTEDKAINQVITDLEDRYRMNEDTSDMSKEDFNVLAAGVATDLREYGHAYDNFVDYSIYECEVQ